MFMGADAPAARLNPVVLKATVNAVHAVPLWQDMEMPLMSLLPAFWTVNVVLLLLPWFTDNAAEDCVILIMLLLLIVTVTVSASGPPPEPSGFVHVREPVTE